MAIKLDITKETEGLFKGNPDIEATITIDGEDHVWTIKKSGRFLKSEFTRYCLQIQGMKDIIDASAGDDDATAKVIDSFKQALDRFTSAFRAQVSSEDGSSDKWIEATATEQDVMISIVSKLLEAISNQESESNA